MEKKIKYLLGLFIFGFGLLFNSQSFARYNINVELVTLPLLDGGLGANYLYKTSLNCLIVGGIYGCFNGYSLFYNGENKINVVSSTYTGLFNNSYFGPDFYSKFYFSSSFKSNISNINSSVYTPNFKLLLGNGVNFGNNFLLSNINVGDDGKKPKYGFGSGFLVNNDFIEVLSDNIGSFIRFFYNQNINLSSPVDGFDFVTMTGNSQTGSIAWQYFLPNGFRYQTKNQSSPKVFGDLGGQYKKTKTIGGYGVGYSFVLDTLNGAFIRWDDFSFVSVGSRCLQPLMELGLSDPNSGTSSGCQQVGLLVLKGDSYVSRNNNASVLLLSKNPQNKSQILFEQFDCAEDDLSRIFDTNYCTSLSHGFITIDGSSEVLPFGSSSSYTIGSGNKFLDFLLTGSSFFNISINGNQYCLNGELDNNNSNNNTSVCFSLTNTPNLTSLKEYYLNGQIEGIPSFTNGADITEQMILSCKGPFYNTPDGLPPSYCNTIGQNFTGNYYSDIGVDGSGNIVISILEKDSNNSVGLSDTTFVLDGSGNYTAYCSGSCNGNYIYYGQLYQDEVFSSSGYFNNFFNKTGRFFQCPYSYSQKIIIGKKLINFLGGYDPFVPINCFIASFEVGKNTKLFNSGFVLVPGGPLFSNMSDSAQILYKFLDFLFILGIILFGNKIFKFFKK